MVVRGGAVLIAMMGKTFDSVWEGQMKVSCFIFAVRLSLSRLVLLQCHLALSWDDHWIEKCNPI